MEGRLGVDTFRRNEEWPPPQFPFHAFHFLFPVCKEVVGIVENQIDLERKWRMTQELEFRR